MPRSSNEVVVTGMRQSMRDSVIMKQNSDLITDNISTADIGQLPDVTIAEELNRLPGVNTTRDRGNASQAAIRGLGPRLVFGLVNGREVASSEPSQDLRWEIYPSEVLSGAQVYKTQDATLIPGGIAGTVDIRTISAARLHRDRHSVSAAGPPTTRAPRICRTTIRTVFAAAVATSVTSTTTSPSRSPPARKRKRTASRISAPSAGTRRTTRAAIPATSTATAFPTTPPGAWSPSSRKSCRTATRCAGALGWRPSDTLEIKADALWSQYKIGEDQFQAWYGNNITGNWANGNSAVYNAPGNSYQVVDGSVVAADLNGAFPNYESSINNYQREAHAAGHRPECQVGNRHLEKHRRPVLLGSLAQESLGGHLSIGRLSAEPGVRRDETGRRRSAPRRASIRRIRRSSRRADSARTAVRT